MSLKVKFADRHDLKNFYNALRMIYGPTSPGSFPLLTADGASVINDKEKILQRWSKHFSNLLNQKSSINDEAINRLPQVPMNDTLDDLPTVTETKQAIANFPVKKPQAPTQSLQRSIKLAAPS